VPGSENNKDNSHDVLEKSRERERKSHLQQLCPRKVIEYYNYTQQQEWKY
jgi:hypothetical protein